MATIKLKPDDLDEQARRFEPVPLREPVFLNSLRKSGSHLLANILRMFVSPEQQYRGHYIQWPTLREHRGAFDPARNLLSVGHLVFGDTAALELAQVRKILLYRDPYTWVLAQARFFLSDQFQGELQHLKDPRLPVDDLLTMMILGIRGKYPALPEMYAFNVVGWMGSDTVHRVRYEDILLHRANLESEESAAYFRELLGACGIAPFPEDWAERVRVGGDPSRSGTARENLTGIAKELPEELPEKHRRLIEFAAPGLRRLLGYE
jgi:hypothetical protein